MASASLRRVQERERTGFEHTSRLHAVQYELYGFISDRQSSFAAATPFEMCVFQINLMSVLLIKLGVALL